MQKIKKYFPLITGLVILLSVAAYGTRAYFSDSTEEQAGIDLTLGSVDVSSKSNEWKYNPNGEVNNDIEGLSETGFSVNGTITDARPGDAFSKIFTFKNTGSLAQVLTFDSMGNESVGSFTIDWIDSSFDENNSIILEPEAKATVTMKISVPLNENEAVAFSNEGANTNNKIKDVNNFIGDTVGVKAVQANAVNNQ